MGGRVAGAAVLALATGVAVVIHPAAAGPPAPGARRVAAAAASGSPATAAASGSPAPPVPVVSTTAGADPPARAVLSLAVRGARSVDYEGTQAVVIRTQRGFQTGSIHVARGSDDQLVIEAQPQDGSPGWVVTQNGSRRASMGLGTDAGAGSQAELSADIEPMSNVARLLQKYRVALAGRVVMLQRPAWVLLIERASDARLVERWTVDAATGLILKRESYDRAGQLERSITFTSVREPYPPPAADLNPPPGASPEAQPQQSFDQGQVTGFARSAGLPVSLPDGYQALAGSRFKAGRSSVVQLIYSDGLEEVSLFQQPGTLSAASVPTGARKVALAHESGYLWDFFPRGAAWQAGSHTETLVGALPSDEVQAIANALPQGPMDRSLTVRAQHLVDWLRHLF
jgi:negative regulator of sigma E activity